MYTSLYRDMIETNAMLHGSAQNLEGEVVSRYSPIEIRETISKLVAEDRLDLASALAEAGLALYPRSEDVLAIGGLLAMLKEDWRYSVALLNELLDVQGDAAPISSHLMFVRALRCAKEPAAALSAVLIAHEKYPNHPELKAEFESVAALLGITSTE